MVGSKLKRSLIAARRASRSQSSACACGGQLLVDDPLQDLLAQVEQPLALLDHRRADLVGQAIERRGPILEDAGRIGIRAELPVDRRAQEGRLQLHRDDREAVGGVRIGRARLGQVFAHAREHRPRRLRQAGRRVLARLRRHRLIRRGLALLLLLVRRLGRVAPLEDLAAQRIDRLALLVHHVVVLEQVLADVEVVALDLLLRVLDRAVDPGVLDRDVLFHPEALHEAW